MGILAIPKKIIPTAEDKLYYSGEFKEDLYMNYGVPAVPDKRKHAPLYATYLLKDGLGGMFVNCAEESSATIRAALEAEDVPCSMVENKVEFLNLLLAVKLSQRIGSRIDPCQIDCKKAFIRTDGVDIVLIVNLEFVNVCACYRLYPYAKFVPFAKVYQMRLDEHSRRVMDGLYGALPSVLKAVHLPARG